MINVMSTGRLVNGKDGINGSHNDVRKIEKNNFRQR